MSTSGIRSRGTQSGLIVVGMILLVVLLGGCGSADNATSTSTSARPTPSTAVYSTALDVTTINGEVPPAPMLPLQDVSTMLDTIVADGERLVVTQGTRLPGTRVAIHTHKYGGHTCVMSGVITDLVEGHEPMVWPAGTCYYMPPDTLMTAMNLGTEPAVLIDNFTLPLGEPTITIREPGWPG